MIYVASSWRNEYYRFTVNTLKLFGGFDVYDWRDEEGFHWSDVFGEGHSGHVEHWTDPIPALDFKRALADPRAQRGFERDMLYLRNAEAFILLLPCGKSAHLEAGWAVGANKPTCVFMPEAVQPELMYGMFGTLYTDISEVMEWCNLNAEQSNPS